MALPPLLVASAFSLAAMAPIIAVTLLVLASMPRWRVPGVRGLIIALGTGVGCILLLFVGHHTAPQAQTFDWNSALVALGAGFSVGGSITCLWYVTRRVPANPTAGRDSRKNGPHPSP